MNIPTTALCKPHKAFPCKLCGTQHYADCTCGFCVAIDDQAKADMLLEDLIATYRAILPRENEGDNILKSEDATARWKRRAVAAETKLDELRYRHKRLRELYADEINSSGCETDEFIQEERSHD